MAKKAAKKSSPKRPTLKAKAPKAAPRARAAAKYEQPGAPWWKGIPSPPPKEM